MEGQTKHPISYWHILSTENEMNDPQQYLQFWHHLQQRKHVKFSHASFFFLTYVPFFLEVSNCILYRHDVTIHTTWPLYCRLSCTSHHRFWPYIRWIPSWINPSAENAETPTRWTAGYFSTCNFLRIHVCHELYKDCLLLGSASARSTLRSCIRMYITVQLVASEAQYS